MAPEIADRQGQGPQASVIGWDVGGAHLKAARVEGGRIVEVMQQPLPLWTGLKRLPKAIAAVTARMGEAASHHVTMTAELSDIFSSRAEGVAAIAEAVAAALPGRVRIYAGPDGLVEVGEAAGKAAAVASANWHATARLVALACPQALVVDMGSTTTDIIPVTDRAVAARGYSDAERMASGELVYVGAVRTPLMALAARVPFAGRWHDVAAEYFATMADVNRLLGRLDEDADQYPPADGKGKSAAESRVRLARMIGSDAGDASDAAWADLAGYFAECQIRRVHDAAALVLGAVLLGPEAPVVGCGVGRSAAAELARRLGRPHSDLAQFIPADDPALRSRAAGFAPAVAVALL
ncbi:hydantoinase/oxoprolinase family protein [Methylobrevis pamukkalensis]|uniref:Hydantoinase/oxoprolinase n=1 Tax=Methylobrevis pamukkalensis TaxID=1439726 RepID=A0A1E3H6E8_9HYPH|nr:hydantoinase/oxoprolinase family protein [Methylobrevis pamukkalensis]ODN71366.1 Hydantoinase/oxoprolinase [Methylobrevis pamukkalensis]